MGRRRSLPLRPDWEEIKDQVMLRGVLRKFETHADIRAVLLATGKEATRAIFSLPVLQWCSTNWTRMLFCRFIPVKHSHLSVPIWTTKSMWGRATLFFMDNKGDCVDCGAIPLIYLLVSYNCPPARTFYSLISTVVPIGAQL